MTIARLHAVPDQCADTAIETLRDLLAQAEAGNVIAITGVVEYRGGSYGHFGSSTMSRLQTSGVLLEAAIKRLGFQD